jgi:hypothetical protein
MEAATHALDQKHFRLGIKLTSEEDATSGTRKVIYLMLLTDVGDIIQRQVQNNDLNKTRECCGDNLRQEHSSRRDLHVVSKLQIRDKTKRLRPRQRSVSVCAEVLQVSEASRERAQYLHCDVSICFKTRHSGLAYSSVDRGQTNTHIIRARGRPGWRYPYKNSVKTFKPI